MLICNNCKITPVWIDTHPNDTIKKVHDYCGRTCSRKAGTL